MSRSTRRWLRKAELIEYRASPIAGRRCIPSEFTDRCFNCLSFNHRIATCQLPRRCLRCHGFCHITRDGQRPRATPLDGAKRTGPAAHAPATRATTTDSYSFTGVLSHALAVDGSWACPRAGRLEDGNGVTTLHSSWCQRWPWRQWLRR
ncbi:unnamed protein product [Urochloa humidicola]